MFAAGPFLLLAGDSSTLTPFAFAAILISLGVIPVAVTRVNEPRIDAYMPVHVAELFHISPLGAIGALSAGAVNGAFWGMAPVFGQCLPLYEAQIAQLMSATILGGALLQWPIGHLSDRLDRRVILVLISLATASVAVLAGVAMELSGPVGLPAVSAALAAALALFGFYRMTCRAPPPIADQTDFVPMMRTTPIALEMHPEAGPSPELDLPMPGPEN